MRPKVDFLMVEGDITNVDFINKEWVQLNEKVTTRFNYTDRKGNKIRYTITAEAGFLFDGASVPKIPFIRKWRWKECLRIPSLIHDIMFIHKHTGTGKDHKYSADVMKALMAHYQSKVKIPVYVAVLTPLARRLFNGTKVTDAVNLGFSSIKSVISL
jgi:hypothetical protein